MMLLPQEITTPALVVDQAQLERNLRDMADSVAARGMRLRPHAKTHKTAEIGRLQLGMGAVGLTVATIGEAEKFADAGVTDLFIAYPLWPSPPRMRRLAALAERISLRLAVESTEAAARLAQLSLLTRPPEILVEIDSGHHRTGVAPGQAGEVALATARASLPLAGVFTFPGHSYAPGGRARAAADEATALGAASAALRAAGAQVVSANAAGRDRDSATGTRGGADQAHGAAGAGRAGQAGAASAAVHIDGTAEWERSGGSTPTAALRTDPPLTEVRPGVYVFNDAQQLELGVCGDDQIALAAAATVVSRHVPGRFVLDSGSKVLGADAQPWSSGFGRLLSWPGARIVAVSEHHATVAAPGSTAPELGEIVAVVPNHVCAAVNLADELLIVRNGAVVDTWPVMARGANS